MPRPDHNTREDDSASSSASSKEPGPTEDPLEGLSPGARDFLMELQLFKSVFTGRWFEELGGTEELGEHRGDFERLSRETREQAEAVAKELHEWDRNYDVSKSLGAATHMLRDKLLAALLEFKSTTTEVFLAAAMQAPTDEYRQTFIGLADRDRQHADNLRRMLGTRRPREVLEEQQRGTGEGAPLGAHQGRQRDGSLRQSVQAVKEEIETSGGAPARLVVGPVGLRHLRDEGVVDKHVGTVFDLPVDLDLSWRGECFAIETTDRASLAEIISSVQAGEDMPF